MPTKQQYAYFTFLFSHYNQRLFEGKLPEVMITISKLPMVASGVFLSRKWNRNIHEICFNPKMLTNENLQEFHQVLAHEMVHLWQQEFGKASRNGYHNKQWANKMLEVGLIPTDNGTETGRKTGQRVGDIPKPDGAFLHAFSEVKHLKIPLTFDT